MDDIQIYIYLFICIVFLPSIQQRHYYCPNDFPFGFSLSVIDCHSTLCISIFYSFFYRIVMMVGKSDAFSRSRFTISFGIEPYVERLKHSTGIVLLFWLVCFFFFVLSSTLFLFFSLFSTLFVCILFYRSSNFPRFSTRMRRRVRTV